MAGSKNSAGLVFQFLQNMCYQKLCMLTTHYACSPISMTPSLENNSVTFHDWLCDANFYGDSVNTEGKRVS